MSFVIQVKNPLAPVRGEVQVRSKGVEYSKDLMRGVFGCAEGLLEGRDEKGEGEGGEEDAECDSDSDSEEETEGEGGEGSEGEGEGRKTKEGGQGGHTKGREEYGLRFASCETTELLDYTGAQIILIPSKVGMEGLEQDIGRDRARALRHAEEVDAEKVDLEGVLGQLGLDGTVFRLDALKGEWV
ncbi:hypothetical protein BDN72DRAFT_840303 [Pluteus cervinus]|uniref:Uncharacterized protein n=1 Tax=Pluteus cervinus TaxID=181527 RepID=A0ACD3AVR4_9AGAR|nr:hypothetical protein BDN72DRAFT_840303 [Pluteus cervinus]